MCHELIGKEPRATRESVTEKITTQTPTTMAPSARMVSVAKRQSDHAAFEGFIARLQHWLARQEGKEVEKQEESAL